MYELRAEPTTLGGAIGIMSNGLRLLDRLGVYSGMLALGHSTQTVSLHSMRGHVLADERVVEPDAKHGYLRIKRTDILDVLLGAAEKASIPVLYNKSITSIHESDSGVTATFSDGSTDTADVLFGCDGIHSAVRTLYVDPGAKPEYFGVASLGSIVSTKGLPAFKGINAMLTTKGTFMAMPCTQDASQVQWGFQREMPLPDSSSARDGWEVRREEQMATFKDHVGEVLADANGEWGATMREMVDRASVLKMYPIYRLAVGGKWHKGRVVLMGDAAHATPPQAGQGLSMALEDVFLLSRLLAGKRELTEVFDKYDEVRRPRCEQISKLAVKNAGVRKEDSDVKLFVKEVVVWLFFSLRNALGLGPWGMDQGILHYDVDEVDID